MAYDLKLAERTRDYLQKFTRRNVEEKKMFGGLGFMINGKMCINISGNRLMCRYDPVLQAEVSEKKGYLPMIMKGKEMKGYCYVEPEGFSTEKDFRWWMELSLDFNDQAKSSKKK